MRRRELAGVVGLALGLVAGARADTALLALLQRGGHVILMRHAQTEPGVGDPEGMVLGDCASQRNLSEAGRAQAVAAGAALRAQQVPIERLVASPWCRCVDTARLAFGRAPQTSTALGNLFGRSDLQGRQVAQMKALVERPDRGNRVLVSHGSTIQALTGVYLAPAEVLVVTPQGGGGSRSRAGCRRRRADARDRRRRGSLIAHASSRAQAPRWELPQSDVGCGAWKTDQRPSLNRYSADDRRAPGPPA